MVMEVGEREGGQHALRYHYGGNSAPLVVGAFNLKKKKLIFFSAALLLVLLMVEDLVALPRETKAKE